jgi:hypothetical protein
LFQFLPLALREALRKDMTQALAECFKFFLEGVFGKALQVFEGVGLSGHGSVVELFSEFQQVTQERGGCLGEVLFVLQVNAAEFEDIGGAALRVGQSRIGFVELGCFVQEEEAGFGVGVGVRVRVYPKGEPVVGGFQGGHVQVHRGLHLE